MDFGNFASMLCPEPVLAHPLLPSSSRQISTNAAGEEEKKKSTDQQQTEFIDPLGAAAAAASTMASTAEKIGDAHQATKAFEQAQEALLTTAETGPLDNTLAKPDEDAQMEWPIRGLDPSEPQMVGFVPWREIRQRILDKFKTNDRLTLESSYLTRPEMLAEGRSTNASTATQKKQQRQRISAVMREKRRQNSSSSNKAPSQPEPAAHFHDLGQEEWCRKLVELRKQLLRKWQEERRQDCIQLISELLAQLSGNICSAQFYPAQFVHITDLLDLFAWLVWQRLRRLAGEERARAGLGPLPLHWTVNEVLGETRLKARNWFGKVEQTVRPLAPRIYMLAAILPCQRFMDPWPGAAQANALELCRVAQQVQHPLISSYLRCYLCRAAMRVQPLDRAPHWKCLNDWLQTYTQQPICLLWPAMEWLVQCVAHTAVAYGDLHPLWEYCRRADKRPLVLVPMLNALPRLYLGEHALEACRIVTASELVTGEELCALGRNLLEAELPRPALKPILRSAWKCVLRLGSPKEFLACSECWAQFVVRHFGANELQVLLENVLRKLQQDRLELYQHQLLSILSGVLLQAGEVRHLLGMDVFAKYFDIFRPAPAQMRVQACRLVLNAVVEKHQLGTFRDVCLANQLLSVCRLLHDSLELAAPAGPLSSALRLIQAALGRVDLRAEPEQCLAFLVSCRADLANWDLLQCHVIRRVQAFSLGIARSVRHSSSRAAFLQACLANQFVSIPSLADPWERLELALQSAQIAQAALAFSHADSFLRFATDQFLDLPNSSSPQRLLWIGTQFLATLAMAPAQGQQQWHLWKGHFQRFVRKTISLQPPPPSSPSLDRLRLLLGCLQTIFVVQANQTRPSPSVHAIDGRGEEELAHTLGQKPWTMLPDGAEKEKAAGLGEGEEEDLADSIAGAMEAELLAENIGEPIYTVGLELLELIGQFGGGGEDLPPRLRSLAKAVYKKCRKRPALAVRISRLKAASGGAGSS